MMTTQQIAERLVALCRENKYEEAQRELYAPEATSHEPYATPAFEQVTQGLPAIIEKGKKFTSMIETMHQVEVSDPLVAGNAFACRMRLDVTMRGQGRMDMAEICLYTVKDGKIIREEFHV